MKEDNILDMNNKSRLTADITFLMLKGAGYAALVVVAIWFFIAAFAAIGRALPEESRSTPDPINRAAPMEEPMAAPVMDEAATDDAEAVVD
ncbi:MULTISPECIES: RC-LH1 core complex protein PufX [unclassified Yoonia]|uniref:RC-LH1 core complex protein PufX n=1 Tax=unclassified Yoonia TaxID=2629118 RepID=UPI002AFE0C0F|nr:MULTISPECIES: RC-LH1 core complex protein PufX [unclassified Yoonia]